MKTLNTPQQSGMPMSAQRHPSPQELAVLTRANHDMRSPLSVILGVFELLEDAGSLTDSERRYLQLGMKAADELLTLADGLRLYSAMERNLVTLDTAPLDLAAMAKAALEAALSTRGVNIETAPAPEAGVRALGDAGYLKLALTSLTRHLAVNLPNTDEPKPPAMALSERVDDQGRVALEVAPQGHTGATTGNRSDSSIAAEVLEQDELGVVNGVRLIELMGGSVCITAEESSLVITLPAAAEGGGPY